MSSPELNPERFLVGPVLVSAHRGDDDLLSAGLGADGLLAATPPPLADASRPTVAELRRRAIYSNWRNIADLASPQGLAQMASALPSIPGREWQAAARIAGRRQTHRLLAQVPDAFDQRQRCLVVTAASGSRGIYGAIAVASAWALPKGLAVVHTDKGAGCGYFDLDQNEGADGHGNRHRGNDLVFDPRPLGPTPAHRIAMGHAHGGDNSEADWGVQVLQAAAFGLHALDQAFPAQAPFTAANTRIIAVGISNGGGAVLRAAELAADDFFAAVVAGAPNISVAGARPLFDYATEAALWVPAALTTLADGPRFLTEAQRQQIVAARCQSLAAAGLIRASDLSAQTRSARAHLADAGFSDAMLQLAEFGVAGNLWRAVAASYSQAYARAAVDQPVCGYGFAVLDAAGQPRASTAVERAIWWSDSSGVAPTLGIGIVDTLASGSDPGFAALAAARALWQGADGSASAVRAAIAEGIANARPHARHLHILHGIGDGLIPIDFSSRPYVAAVRANGIAIDFTELPHTQHFDAYIALPGMGHYQALLPPLQRALDRALAVT